MINEFFKSIFRTLGRIAAYILLGVLAYLILSWFGLPNVKAETIEGNYYYIQSITENWQVGTFAYGTSLNDYTNRTLGFQYVPVQSNDLPIALNQSEYYINIKLVVAFNTTQNLPIVLTPVIGVGSSYTTATCDGYEAIQISDTRIANNQLYLTYDYSCDQLLVNSNFDRIRFRFYQSSIQNNIWPVQFYITETSIIDVNDLNPDVEIIKDKMDEWFLADQQYWEHISELTTITNSRLSDINYNITQMQQAQYNTTQSVEHLEGAILDDDDADIGFVEEIADWMPIDTPVTDIITLPINILNKTINSFGGTCSPYTINTGSLLGNQSWTFPCLNIGQYFTGYSYQGYNLWQLIDLMICMYMGYEILMLIMSAYNSIANLDDPFDSLYQPRHEGYKPKHGEGRL